MSWKLTDKLNRNLGSILQTWDLEGGIGGRFHPGTDFPEVELLFEQYEQYVGGRGDAAFEKFYEQLVSLKPRLISEQDGSITRYRCAIISKVPNGYSITLVHHGA